MPLVSIITICKNSEQDIELTLQSIANQTFADFEYIVVDGASTDGTLDIIRKYGNRVNKLVSERDTGIYNAQNKGARLAEGEYLLFLNSGDYLNSNDTLARFAAANPCTEIVYGDIIVLLRSGYQIRKISPGRISLPFMTADALPHPGSFIRKSLFDKLGGYNEDYRIAGDFEFFIRALFVNNIKTKYLRFPIAVFNYFGISTSPAQQQKAESEKLKAITTNIKGKTLFSLKLTKWLYIIFKKNPGILYSIFLFYFYKFFGKNYLE